MKAVFILGAALLMQIGTGRSQSPASIQEEGRDPKTAHPPSPAPAPAAQGGFLGKDVPLLDPGSEVMTWDGKIWNIQDQRVYRARFEKYLNAEEETSADAKRYREQFE